MGSAGQAARWAAAAIRRLDDDAGRIGCTPLLVAPLPAQWGVTLLLKDESAQPTRTLKHRAARALYRLAIASGAINEGTTVVEATGGGAAVAQAYFADLLGLDYIAVMPGEPDPARVAAVEQYGGRCHFVTPPPAIYAEARRLAQRVDGHYLDQFGRAERALDWRTDSLATELFTQLAGQDAAQWVVVGAGTGATSASLGRYIRYHGLPTRLAVVDPENSAYYPGWVTGAVDYATGMPSRIEGIGRPRMEPGFLPALIEVVVPVADAASVAAARVARSWTGLPVGASTGTGVWGALELIARMRATGTGGAVVTLVCDASDRHLGTHHDDEWVAHRDLHIAPFVAAIEDFLQNGRWEPPRLRR